MSTALNTKILNKFSAIPIEVEAIQFMYENKNQVYSWATELQNNVRHGINEDEDPIMIIPTLEGEMICAIGDFLVKEPFPTDWRKVYPVKQEIFVKRYIQSPDMSCYAAPTFENQMRELINKFSKENGSDTPDFILAQHLAGCLEVFDRTLKSRDEWYGKKAGPF